MISILRKKHRTIVSNKKKYNSYRVRYRRKKRNKIRRCVLIISGAALFILLMAAILSLFFDKKATITQNDIKVLPKLTLQEKLIKKNKYSRPGLKLKKVKGIVVHYTANPGTDAEDNQAYFNNLPKINEGRNTPIYASSHFIVGLEGQIIQCVPLDEIAYASNERNSDTISIECCHKDKSGKFNSLTYKALLELLQYLCIRFDLEEDDIIRHYDVTGKKCPLYYVKHEDEWEQLKKEVKMKIN